MDVPNYTPEALRALIALSTQLQFWDDVAHWKKLLEEAEKKENAQ